MDDTAIEHRFVNLETRMSNLEKPTQNPQPSKTRNTGKYQTNFVKGPKGNGIKTGQELIVRIKGAEVVTAKLSYQGKLLQVDQSHAKDEDNDTETINLKLKTKSRFFRRTVNLLPGTYELHVWYWDNDTMMGGSYRDKFEITP